MNSVNTAQVDELRAEVQRLKEQLARSKARDFHFLGEVIAGDLLADLTKGGKLSARGVQTRPEAFISVRVDALVNKCVLASIGKYVGKFHACACRFIPVRGV